jgi:hypothetical protein
VRLSLTDAAGRAHVAPKTLKAWHAAGLISAVSVGRRGVSWRFDAETLERELADLPRCAYRDGCDRPVAEEGTGCQAHRLAVAGNRPSPELVEELARRNRKHEDRDYFCEAVGADGEVCGRKLAERKGWRIAQRRREGDDGILRCPSCAAVNRHKKRPLYGRARAEAEASGLVAGLDELAGRLPAELRCTPGSVSNHIRAGGLSTTTHGRLHVINPDEIPSYVDWLRKLHEQERRKRSESRKAFVATEAGQAHQARVMAAMRRFHSASTTALFGEGLVPTKVAAGLLYRAPTTVRRGFALERRQFGGLVRLGVDARVVYERADDKHLARSKLAKALAVRNGTSQFGRARKLSKDEVALALSLRLADPAKWGWGKLTDRLNEDRSPNNPVTRPTVRAAVLRELQPLQL